MKRLLLRLVIVLITAFVVIFMLLSDEIYDGYHGAIDVIEKVSLQDVVIPQVKNGFDWSLPESTKNEPYSGLVDENDNSDLNSQFVILRWDHTNPSLGKYDFSELSEKLKEIPHRNVLVRLDVNSACEAPKWALKKLRVTKNKSLIFWDKLYLNLLKPYIYDFGKRFSNHHQVVGVQLGIADGEYKGSCDENDNKDGWGEFWMSPQELAEAEKDFGLTPDLFLTRTKQIIDIYVEAFKGNEAKLAFTNIDPFFSWDDISEAYDKKMPEISSYVMEQGLGSRDGNVEAWLRYVGTSYGIKHNLHKDGTCSMEMEESFARFIQGRYWGTENEFYGKDDYVLDYGGPIDNQPYRFLISSLRALQMRRNFMTVSTDGLKNLDDPIYLTKDFIEYLRHTMGKQIENTSDVFVLLGERYISSSSFIGVRKSEEICIRDGKVSVRSFGRWMTEKSESIPAVKIKMPKSEKYWAQDMYLPNGVDYEYAGRFSTQFNFDINDELIKKRCNNKCNAEVKVTIKDQTKTHFSIKVPEGETQLFQSTGDDKIKTITFPVISKFDNKHGKDLIIQSGTSGVSVLFVRVNFLQ